MTELQVDSGLLSELKDILGAEFPALVQTFTQDSLRQQEAMQAAVQAQDAEALRRAAHSLKGASANLGLQSLQVLCQQLEDAAQQQNLPVVAALLRALPGQRGQAVEYLQRQL